MKNLIYETKIKTESNKPKINVGATRRTFKARFDEYKKSFSKANFTAHKQQMEHQKQYEFENP